MGRWWDGDWGFRSFQVPCDFRWVAIIPSLFPLFTSCFAIINLRLRAFDRGFACRNRARIYRETKNFCVIVSEVGWLSLRVVRRGKCLQPRSTAAGEPGKHRSTPFSEERKLNNFLALVVYQNLFFCVINTIFSKSFSIDVKFWKPSAIQ